MWTIYQTYFFFFPWSFEAGFEELQAMFQAVAHALAMFGHLYFDCCYPPFNAVPATVASGGRMRCAICRLENMYGRYRRHRSGARGPPGAGGGSSGPRRCPGSRRPGPGKGLQAEDGRQAGPAG